MFRPLLNTISERDDYLAGVKEDIVTGKEDLIQLNKELDEQREQVIKEAGVMVQALESEGDQQASAFMQDVRKQMASLRDETEREIKAQVDRAREELVGEVDAITVAIMENILHRRLS
jgi:F0F1-type ATP synthase membrane subunit b/b'